MIDSKDWLGASAIAIGGFSDVVYIRSILNGTSRPHVFTWIIWDVIFSIIFFGQITAHAGAGAWLTGYNVLVNIVIITLVLRRGEKRIARSDWIALAVALAGIPVWYAMQDPTWSICLEATLAACIFWPTIRKSFVDPYSEKITAWFFFTIPVVLTLMATKTYSLATVVYPVSSGVLDMAFVFMLLWRRRVLARARG